LFEVGGFRWIKIPWLPLSVMGIAVAFFAGFKNNNAYERLWEARKIWGGIVNSSRAYGSSIRAYVGNQFTVEDLDNEALSHIHKRIIHRHIGWLYALRKQMLIPAQWEHFNQGGRVARTIKQRMKSYGIKISLNGAEKEDLHEHLHHEEVDHVLKFSNTATHIIDKQSQELKHLRSENLIDDFRHMELQNQLNNLYTLQGQCERIKKFPLPRQYGSISLIFIVIFIMLLPFGMITEFDEMGDLRGWLTIPFSLVVGWIFILMELVADSSENPFEGNGNSIPMLSLCRTIEIDLKQMLGDTDIPPPIEPINDVLR